MNICVNLNIKLRIIPTLRIITEMTWVICLVCHPKCTPPVRLFWQSVATWAKGGSWPSWMVDVWYFFRTFLFFFKRQKPTGGKSITSTTHLFNFAIKNHKLTNVSKGPRSLMTKGRFLIAAVNSEAVKALERLWFTDLGPWQRWGIFGRWFSSQAAWIHLHTGFLATNGPNLDAFQPCRKKHNVPWYVFLLSFFSCWELKRDSGVALSREASLADLPRIPAWSVDRSSTVV